MEGVVTVRSGVTKLLTALFLLFLVQFASTSPSWAQQHEGSAGASEHEFHRNHGATFLGATTHLDHNDTGFTIGTDYARRWGLIGVGASVEMASSSLERDIIIGVPVFLYPWRGSSFFVAPSVEIASTEAEEGEETELEALFRFGTAYWFALNETIAVAPTFMADVVQGHWTLVYGISFGVGW
jgi:hypothetical protein